jgi:hypothetical protein
MNGFTACSAVAKTIVPPPFAATAPRNKLQPPSPDRLPTTSPVICCLPHVRDFREFKEFRERMKSGGYHEPVVVVRPVTVGDPGMMPSGRFVARPSIRLTIESRVGVNDRVFCLRPGRKTRGPGFCHNAESNEGSMSCIVCISSRTTLSIEATGWSVNHHSAATAWQLPTRPEALSRRTSSIRIGFAEHATESSGRYMPGTRHALRPKSFRLEAARRSYRRVRSPFPLAYRHPRRLPAPRYSLRWPGHVQRSSYSPGYRQRGRSGVRGS